MISSSIQPVGDSSLADEIQKELDHARAAQQKGNAGMARVCARRAAGIALRKSQGKRGSAVEHLRALAKDASAPESIRQAAERLGATVQKDHTVPFDENPIQDAELIVAHCQSQ